MVSVRNSLLYPNSPRAGTRNSRRIRDPIAFMCRSSPFLSPMLWNTGPVLSPGTSTMRRSMGSYFTPSIS